MTVSTSTASCFSIEAQGPFSLEEAARFGFGQREAARYDGVMRLAFCVDGYRQQAAAWAVHSARRPHAIAAAVRRSLNLAHGTTFHVEGETVDAFPTPEQLLDVSAFPGIDALRLQRLHGVAIAALDGRLDASRLS